MERIVIIDRRLSASNRAMIEANDIRLTALLPVYAALASLYPEKKWETLIRRFFVPVDKKGPPDTIVQGIETSRLQSKLSRSSQGIASSLNAFRLESYFQYLRDYSLGGWPVNASVENESTLCRAKQAGQGVILWVGHFVFNGLPLKKAMHIAGYQVFHLSRPEHGFSSTRYGVKILNPLRSHIESRYLAKRIIIERGSEPRALREAHHLLRCGQVISITAGHWEGRRLALAPIGDAVLPLSVGAPSLAHATGAALLPVFIVREKTSRYRVIVGEQLACSQEADRNEVICTAVADFARQLTPVLLSYPDQWRGWKYLKPPRHYADKTATTGDLSGGSSL